MMRTDTRPSPRWWAAARARVKNAIEGPDPDIDRIISGVLDAGGVIPAPLMARWPTLAQPDVMASVLAAVLDPSETMPRRWNN